MTSRMIRCDRCGNDVRVHDVLCGTMTAGYYKTPPGSEMARLADAAPNELILCCKCMFNSPGYQQEYVKK